MRKGELAGSLMSFAEEGRKRLGVMAYLTGKKLAGEVLEMMATLEPLRVALEGLCYFEQGKSGDNFRKMSGALWMR